MKSAGPVSEIDELQGIDRRVPCILRLLQGKLQLTGAAYAAPHQDQPAKPNGYRGDHLEGRDGRQTEHQVDKQRGANEGARASSYDELRLRRIASRNSSICASSRSMCLAGVGSTSNIELSVGAAGRNDQELVRGLEADRHRELK